MNKQIFLPRPVNGCSFALRTHMRTHAHAREFFNYLKGSRAFKYRSPAGGGYLAFAAQGRQASGSSVSSLCSFLNLLFFPIQVVHQLRGHLPPARRARGGCCGCCCGAASVVCYIDLLDNFIFHTNKINNLRSKNVVRFPVPRKSDDIFFHFLEM